MRVFIFVCISLLVNITLYGQSSTTFSTFLSSGNNESNISATIGDVFIETLTTDENLLSQGYLQPENNIILSVNNRSYLKFSIYPNPFSDVVFLRSTDSNNPIIDIKKIEIIDAKSIVLASKSFEGNRSPRYALDFSFLTPGVYFLCIYMLDDIQIVKIVKV